MFKRVLNTPLGIAFGNFTDVGSPDRIVLPFYFTF